MISSEQAWKLFGPKFVKLRFLLTYENMLKSIETARSECTVKHENKASYSTNYIVPKLSDFFGDDWKEIKTQIEKRNIHNCKKYQER